MYEVRSKSGLVPIDIPLVDHLTGRNGGRGKDGAVLYDTGHRSSLDLVASCMLIIDIINMSGSGDNADWERKGGGAGILTTHKTKEI